MALELGWGNFYFFKFQNDNFLPEVSPEFILNHKAKIRADDNITDNQTVETKTVILSGGGKLIITQPSEDSANMVLTVLAPLPAEFTALAFVDSIQTISGPKEKTEYFARIGLDLADWTNSVKMQFRPTDAQGVEKGANEWITYGRAAIVPTKSTERGKDEASIEINIQSIGGLTAGSVATHLTDVDLLGGVDFSIGLNKAIKVTIDGKVRDNIDLGNGVATTRLSIMNAINNALGKIALTAEDVAGTELIRFNGNLTDSGFGNVGIDDPTDLVTYATAMTLAFDAGGGPVATVAVDPVEIPVKVEGDETA